MTNHVIIFFQNLITKTSQFLSRQIFLNRLPVQLVARVLQSEVVHRKIIIYCYDILSLVIRWTSGERNLFQTMLAPKHSFP